MPVNRRQFIQGAAVGAAGVVAGAALDRTFSKNGTNEGDAMDVAAARGLSPQDVKRAVSTYVPGGMYDEFYLISSGGHSGQVLVIGVPSMRLLKVIAVFTPDPWQGYGYGADSSDALLVAATDGNSKDNSSSRGSLTWGDTHHPALSETNGEYDGRWAYINDRANGRIAMIDLRDFKTKQIVDVPNLQTAHGGVFATPNTEYVHISTMTPTLLAGANIGKALENFGEVFRGYSSFLAIDQKTGRMDLSKSFQIELPPYTQDLADAGKLTSFGWVFINSYNSEMAVGGNMEGKEPIEIGASKGDYDYMHAINWKRAEEVVVAGKTKTINGMRVIPLEVAAAEGVLYLIPEPRSPHGVDVAPNGSYLTVAGKLDPHVTVYSMEKILQAVKDKNFEKMDRYGVPILRYDDVVAGRVEVGAGPLHTQYDAEGNGYTSLFIESAVAKWTLGEPYFSGSQAFKLVDKISVQYNIGHLVTMEGDTVKPLGKYLVAANKWSIDRYPTIGTLKPQNLQLIDIASEKMSQLADMPVGVGEPHYLQGIRADRIKAWQVYPLGTNPLSMERDPNAVESGKERVERRDNFLEVWATASRSHFKPDIISASQGDRIVIHLTNVETAPDATHGFAIPRYNVNLILDPGETATVEFLADEPGAFALYCTEFCSALHLEMQGWLLVDEATV